MRLSSTVFHHRTPRRTPLVWLLLASLLAPAFAPLPARAYDSAHLRRYPYLTDMVASGSTGYATVNWGTDRPRTGGGAYTGSVRYGRVSRTGACAPTVPVAATGTSTVVNSEAAPVVSWQWQWKAKLRLAPNAQYCYRIYLHSRMLGTVDLLGAEYSPRFRTQIPRGRAQAFTFAVFGDWGYQPTPEVNPHQSAVLGLIARSDARFVINTADSGHPSATQKNYGDLVQRGAYTSAVFGPSYWKKVGARKPLFPVMGNHGLESSDRNQATGAYVHPHLASWPQDEAVRLSGGRYKVERYRSLNGTRPADYPSAWYAFDVGNARFYMLQAGWSDINVGTATGANGAEKPYENDYDHHWAPGRPQYEWLRRDLAAHPSQLKFAFFHYPLYSDNNKEPGNVFLRGRTRLEGLLARYGVDVAFNGHSHTYQRNRKSAGGVISYVTGGGGALLGSVGRAGCSATDAYAIGWSNTASAGNSCLDGVKNGSNRPTSIAQVYHYLRVRVSGRSVTVTPIDSTGRAFDARTYHFPDDSASAGT